MIVDILKTALTTAGCTKILYESDLLSGIITDQATQDDIVGLVIEPNSVKLQVRANTVIRQYPNHIVEIMKQVKPEDTAENNKATLFSLLDITELFVKALINTGSFQKVKDIDVIKIQEKRYDANMIGWSIPINLVLIENKNNCV